MSTRNQTTLSIRKEHKQMIDDAQEALTDELGFEPSKGEAVVYLCRDYVEREA